MKGVRYDSRPEPGQCHRGNHKAIIRHQLCDVGTGWNYDSYRLVFCLVDPHKRRKVALLQRSAPELPWPAISALQDNARKGTICTLGFTSHNGIVDGAGKYTNR